MKIDFFKKFPLLTPVCGLVSKVINPKGIREIDLDKDEYVYKLHTEPTWVYNREPSPSLKAGLYWIMDICKVYDHMMWCHYLFIISEDKKVYPVAEYLNCEDTSWVKQAIKVVKKFFNGDPVQPIKLTKIKYKDDDEEVSRTGSCK